MEDWANNVRRDYQDVLYSFGKAVITASGQDTRLNKAGSQVESSREGGPH